MCRSGWLSVFVVGVGGCLRPFLFCVCLLFAASRSGFGWRPFGVLVLIRRWSRGFSGVSDLHLKSNVVPLQYSARMSYMIDKKQCCFLGKSLAVPSVAKINEKIKIEIKNENEK